MDESNDKYNWKKVFKKFLEPQKPIENENLQRNEIEESISVGSSVDQKKSVSESSLICSSPASNDSGYSGCKFEFYGKLPSETHDTFEPNLNFPQACNQKLEFDNESNFIPPPNYNISKSNDFKTEFYNDLSSKKLPHYEFKLNTTLDSGYKPEFNSRLLSKVDSYDVYGDIPHARAVPESIKIDNFHHGKVPEWKEAFRNILRDNTSDECVSHQKDIYPSKKTGNCKNSDTSGMTSQRKQSNYKPKTRYEKAEKYKDYEAREAEEKVKEIFALSRMFKCEQININDFHGCGVDIFKKDQPSSPKATYGSSKPYLPLTGFVAKLKPYTTADVAASYVPFEEDAWDDDLLI